MYKEILIALIETIEMVLMSGFFAFIVGLPLGVLLYATNKNNFWRNNVIHILLSALVNMGRSIPFIILFIAIMPFTKLLVHKTIGVPAAIVALSVASIPFYARLVEVGLNEIPRGLIEATKAMGATNLQLVYKVLLPECKPALISGLTLTLVNLIGFSAMAGFTGTGGLGAMAINYGYNRYDTQIILITVVLMILLVQIIQTLGDYALRKIYTY
jgi:D-methionine transport system permease protein